MNIINTDIAHSAIISAIDALETTTRNMRVSLKEQDSDNQVANILRNAILSNVADIAVLKELADQYEKSKKD